MKCCITMPTKTKEYSVFAPGNLVTCAKDLYSSTPIGGSGGSENQVVYGTVGLIICGPNSERRAQYQVQFLNNVTWWVNHNEIEPYIS